MAKHKHMWVLDRKVVKMGIVYKFWVCKAPGCPKPDKVTIGIGSKP